MIVSGRAIVFLVLALLISAAISLGVVHNFNVPNWIDGIRIKTYLFFVCSLFMLLIFVFVWWAIYLPSPERWYLACARSCLLLFVASGFAIVGDLGLKFFTADVAKKVVMTGIFQDQGYERIGVFALSVIFLDIFSRKYVKYRN
jgi:hypothetical protein